MHKGTEVSDSKCPWERKPNLPVRSRSSRCISQSCSTFDTTESK